ncbi:MAG: PorP/SprF family type IX secretion system membrane protein [Cyclobacteriaceae bacterium]
MRRNKWFIVALIWLPSFAQAQDQTNFTQFFLNPYLINASYAGVDGQTGLSLIYKKQWMTVNGAPTIANFSLQSPVSPRVSLGLNITNDERGLLNNSAILLTFGYNIALAKESFLRFGISGGGTWNTLDMTKLESLNNDPALANILENNASITGNAGISVHVKSFQLGASMPTVFAPSYVSLDDFTITEIKPFQSIIINASNRFYFNDDKHIFEPYALYRINADLPPQFEVAGILHLNHVIWVGGSYKQDFGISGLGGVKLKNKLAIGASYSLQNSGINELNSPSFEVSLNLLFGKRKKDAPLYSFVNTLKEKEKKPLKKSASELIAEKRKVEEAARKKQLEEQARLKKEEEAAKKKTDEIARKIREEDEAYAKANPPKKPDPDQVQPKDTTHAIEQPLIKVPETPKDKERHETVKRGGHAKELAASEYIIAGAFSSEANANRYTNGLLQLGYNVNFGHLTEKKLWYVYIHQSNDINAAKTERDKYRKLRMFKDAWLLTVQQ